MQRRSSLGHPRWRGARVLAAVAVMFAVSGVAVVAAEPASAVTCQSSAYVWSSAQSFAPGNWCINYAYGKLIFNSDGGLALYSHQDGSFVWASGTANKNAGRMYFGTSAIVRIQNWYSYAWHDLWNSTATTSDPSYYQWDKFMLQIGLDSYSGNSNAPCWTISAHSKTLGEWVNSGIVFSKYHGQCFGTYEMAGGAPEGTGWV